MFSLLFPFEILCPMKPGPPQSSASGTEGFDYVCVCIGMVEHVDCVVVFCGGFHKKKFISNFYCSFCSIYRLLNK